jgi:hypothetical protein
LIVVNQPFLHVKRRVEGVDREVIVVRGSRRRRRTAVARFEWRCARTLKRVEPFMFAAWLSPDFNLPAECWRVHSLDVFLHHATG